MNTHINMGSSCVVRSLRLLRDYLTHFKNARINNTMQDF